MSAVVTPAEERLRGEFLARFPDEAIRHLEAAPAAEVREALRTLDADRALRLWNRLSSDVAQRAIEALDSDEACVVLQRLDPGRAAAVLQGLAPAERARLLSLLPPRSAAEIESVLAFPPDRAGAIMDARVRRFREGMTVGELLQRARDDKRPGRRGFFTVDDDGVLTGWVDMQDLALASPDERVDRLAAPVRAVVEPMTAREEIVEKMEQHHMTDLAVVDLDGHLVGAIRYAELVAAEKEEASLDIQTMVGVSKDERALSKVSFAVRKRLPWLQINLLTAFLAASVVGVFEATIAQFTALAVLLPVVAGQSGNTGAQALAVTMRGLALREIRVSHWPRVVFKETNVGFWNGVTVALTTALGVYVWSGSHGLSLIIGISMVLSMVIAGISGAAIPILLTIAKQDPAQSSSIILTTVTDVAGFFSFLGIATLLSSLI